MSQAKAIPERSQIAPEFTWNTADLYPTDQAWQEDFSRLQAMVPKLAACAGRLGESADALYAYVTLEQEAGELLVKLMDYAQRRSDEDTRVLPPRPWSGSMGKSRSWSCTAGILLSSRTAGSTPCPTRRRSCWPGWGSWPRLRTTSSPSWPTRI